MLKDLEEEYIMLRKTFKKLGGEEEYDNCVKKGKNNVPLFSIRDKIQRLENSMTSADIIDCMYKFIEINKKQNAEPRQKEDSEGVVSDTQEDTTS